MASGGLDPAPQRPREHPARAPPRSPWHLAAAQLGIPSHPVVTVKVVFLLAAAVEARRTWSPLPRALRAGAAADAAVAADATQLGTDGATAYADALDRLPGVVASARTAGVDLGQVGPDGRLNQRLRNGTALG